MLRARLERLACLRFDGADMSRLAAFALPGIAPAEIIQNIERAVLMFARYSRQRFEDIYAMQADEFARFQKHMQWLLDAEAGKTVSDALVGLADDDR